MKLKHEYNIQEVMGSFVAVPADPDAAKYSEMIRMNDTGVFIFEQLKSETTENEIVQKLCIKYDAEEDLLRRDAQLFIKMLNERGLLSL